jgi:hypothetical protein
MHLATQYMLLHSGCLPPWLFLAAVNSNTVRPVAEAAGSAAAAGLNTTIFAEAVAAAYFTGGVPNEAMNEAFKKAAQTGGCKDVIALLERELASGCAAKAEMRLACDSPSTRSMTSACFDLFCACI